MSIWFVPRDAAARSMGADAVAAALIDRGETVVRNGSRGMLWMEPLIERAETRDGGRVGWSVINTPLASFMHPPWVLYMFISSS